MSRHKALFVYTCIYGCLEIKCPSPIGIGQREPGKVVILDGFVEVSCDHATPLTQECADCERERGFTPARTITAEERRAEDEAREADRRLSHGY